MNATQSKPEPAREYPGELKIIMLRAQAGDASAIPELQAGLKQYPELVSQLGDLASHAEQGFLGLVAGSDLLAREVVRLQLQDLKQDLGLEDSSPLERLLIERVALTWLQTHHADLDVAGKLKSGQNPTAALGFAQKRQQQSHARLLASVKALAVVRKLLKPALSPLQVASRLNGHGDVPAAVQARSEGLCMVGN